MSESCTTSVAKAIREKSLVQYISQATIEDEVKKDNCIHDLITVSGISEIDIKAEVIKCLSLLNENLNDKMKLTDPMIKSVVDLVLHDFNTLTIVGFFKCIRNGLKGQYGQVFQMNVLTITGWIQKYLSEEEAQERINLLRNRHYEDKALNGNLEVIKAVFGTKKREPVEYTPKKHHLDQFREIVKLFTDKEIDIAIAKWKKRQRPQYVEILETEKKSRKIL